MQIEDASTCDALLTLDDLRQYTVTVEPALRSQYRNRVILGAPLPCVGSTQLALMLNIADVQQSRVDHNVALHRRVERFKTSFVARRMLGDSSSARSVVERVLSPSSATQCAAMIDDDKVTIPSSYKSVWDRGTTHISG